MLKNMMERVVGNVGKHYVGRMLDTCATGRPSHSFLWLPEPVPVVVPIPKVTEAVCATGRPLGFQWTPARFQ